MERWTDGQMNRHIDRLTDRQRDRWMDRGTDRWTIKKLDKFSTRVQPCHTSCRKKLSNYCLSFRHLRMGSVSLPYFQGMHGQGDVWTNRRMDGQMDG